MHDQGCGEKPSGSYIKQTFVRAVWCNRRQRASSGDKGQPWGFREIKVCNYGATGTITEMICVDPSSAANNRRKAPGSIDDTSSYEKRTVVLNWWRTRKEYSIEERKLELYLYEK